MIRSQPVLRMSSRAGGGGGSTKLDNKICKCSPSISSLVTHHILSHLKSPLQPQKQERKIC